MTQHFQAAQALAAGVHALPSGATAFAATQAAWRFFNNPRVGLSQLVEPLRAAGRQAASTASHLLVVHDWSFLAFATHDAKADRIAPGHDHARGYDLATALLVDGATGDPLAPMDLELTTAQGVLSSRSDRPDPPPPDAHIDQVLATMRAAATWGLAQPLVHVIDREADGLAQFRRWSEAGHRFVVRVDAKRRVEWDGESRTMPQIVGELQARGAFGEVRSLGDGQTLSVAETAVVYKPPGRVRVGPRSAGRRRLVPGEPLTLRLVVSRVHAADGTPVAEWLLVTNEPDAVTAVPVAQWSAWRWRIESFFKLLKRHGHQVESWQQETGAAIVKRLAVTAMACVLVWKIVRDSSPAGQELATLLVRLSGRQMKRNRPVTAPAVLAGLEKLLAVLELLEETPVEKLRELLNQVLPQLRRTG